MRGYFALLGLIGVLALEACDSDLAIMGSAKKNSVTVQGFDQIVGNIGDQIIFHGRNLRPDIEILFSGNGIPFTLIDGTNGSFVVPDGITPGLQQVVFRLKSEGFAKVPLMTGFAIADIPVLSFLSNPPQVNSMVLAVAVGGTGVTHYKYKLRQAADLPCRDINAYSSSIPSQLRKYKSSFS